MCVKNGRCCLCSRIACVFCFRLKVLLHFGHPMRWFRSRVAVNVPTIHDRSCENRSIRASTYVLATSAANHGAISTQVDASAARITIVHRTAVIFRIDRVPSRTGSAIPNLRSPRVSESPQPERVRHLWSSVQERLSGNLSSALPPEFTRTNACLPPLLPSLRRSHPSRLRMDIRQG